MKKWQRLLVVLGACVLGSVLGALLSNAWGADCQEYSVRGVFDGPDPYAKALVVIDCAPACGPEFTPRRALSQHGRADIETFPVETLHAVDLSYVMLKGHEAVEYYASLASTDKDTGCNTVLDCAATAYQHCAQRRVHAAMVVFNSTGGANGCVWTCTDNVAGRLLCGGAETSSPSTCLPGVAYEQCHRCFIGPVEPGACGDPGQTTVTH